MDTRRDRKGTTWVDLRSVVSSGSQRVPVCTWTSPFLLGHDTGSRPTLYFYGRRFRTKTVNDRHTEFRSTNWRDTESKEETLLLWMECPYGSSKLLYYMYPGPDVGHELVVFDLNNVW